MRKSILCATLAAALAAGGSAYAQEQTESGAVMHEFIIAEPVQYVIVEPVELVAVAPDPIVITYYEESPASGRLDSQAFVPDQDWMQLDSAFPRGSTQSD